MTGRARRTVCVIGLTLALTGCGVRDSASERATLPPSGHDRGGMTFDFAACSERSFAKAFDPRKNVCRQPLHVRLTNNWSVVVALPTSKPSRWRVSARYRMSHPAQAGGAWFLIETGTLDRSVFRPNGGKRIDDQVRIIESGLEWSAVSDAIYAPEGSTRMRVMVCLSEGVPVDFELKDLCVVDVTPPQPIEFVQMPMGNLDGRFAIGEGQTGSIEYYWRKKPGGEFDLRRFRFALELPPGVEFLGCSYAEKGTVVRKPRTDGSSEVKFDCKKEGGTLSVWDNNMNPIAVLVRATRGPGVCGSARLSVRYASETGAGFKVAAPPVELFVVPPVRAKAVPERYLNGAYVGWTLRNASPDAIEGFSRTLADGGARWIVGDSASQQTYALWRRLGVRRITPDDASCKNGFMIGNGALPESDRYVARGVPASSRNAQRIARAACPVSVYSESDFFRTNTVPLLRRQLQGADGLWANWEPWFFEGKGCFCDKCARAFAKWIGKPTDEIAREWPACVMKGGRYAGVVRKFRSQEHAKVMLTMDRVIRGMTGGDEGVGFVPAVAWIEMGSWWRPNDCAAEVQPIDYAGRMRWMNPWGPYAAWWSNRPYVDEKRKALCPFFAAKDVREAVDRDYPAGARPKLLALPQGYQYAQWIAQPEDIALALDGYFFNGWEAAVVYFFPAGYDARYWAKFADATERAAKYEGFVLDGVRCDAMVSATPSTGLFAAPVRHLTGLLPDERNRPMLQSVAYEKDGVRIVAVFNFWQKGEAFFDLRIAGLAPGAYDIVSERGEWRVHDGKRTSWSAAELAADGVRLSVGASRCRVFEIRPANGGAGASSVLSDAALERVFGERREDLRKAAERDAAREKANGEIPVDLTPVI